MKKLLLCSLVLLLMVGVASASPTRFPGGVATDKINQPFGDMEIPDPMVYSIVYDDFTQLGVTYGLDTYVATVVEIGTVALGGDAKHGTVVLSASATANSSACLQSAYEVVKLDNAGKDVFYKCRFQAADVVTPAIQIGLIKRDTTPADVSDGIYLLKAAGAATAIVRSVKNSGTTSTIDEVSLGSLSAATYYTIALRIEDASTAAKQKIHVYLDDVKKGTITYDSSTPNICNDEELLHSAYIISSEGSAADTLTIDYIYSASER